MGAGSRGLGGGCGEVRDVHGGRHGRLLPRDDLEHVDGDADHDRVGEAHGDGHPVEVVPPDVGADGELVRGAEKDVGVQQDGDESGEQKHAELGGEGGQHRVPGGHLPLVLGVPVQRQEPVHLGTWGYSQYSGRFGSQGDVETLAHYMLCYFKHSTY